MMMNLKRQGSTKLCRVWLLFTGLALLTTICCTCDLVDVTKGTTDDPVYYPWDPDSSDLIFTTNSVAGSYEKVILMFLNENNEEAGGVWIFFTSPPRYIGLGYCAPILKLPANLSSAVNKVWRISYNQQTQNFKIYCNSVLLVDTTPSDEVCTDSYLSRNWRTYWERDVTKIYFHSSLDTASEQFCTALPGCDGLPAFWNKINTVTTFPVAKGTVLTITCDTGYLLSGSNEVTCDNVNSYSYTSEPTCVLLECAGLNSDWTNMNTDASFPVAKGTVLTVTCDTGYLLSGSNEVTCEKDTSFTYDTEPTCTLQGDPLEVQYTERRSGTTLTSPFTRS